MHVEVHGIEEVCDLGISGKSHKLSRNSGICESFMKEIIGCQQACMD
jgi:hypothetical protein